MSLKKDVAELKAEYEAFIIAYTGFDNGTKARAADARKALKAIMDLAKEIRKGISEEKNRMGAKGGRKARGGADDGDDD